MITEIHNASSFDCMACDNKTNEVYKLEKGEENVDFYGIALCVDCQKDLAFTMVNSSYKREVDGKKVTNPVSMFYCDEDPKGNYCGKFLVMDKTRTCGCGRKYRVNHTPLGMTVDKVMA